MHTVPGTRFSTVDLTPKWLILAARTPAGEGRLASRSTSRWPRLPAAPCPTLRPTLYYYYITVCACSSLCALSLHAAWFVLDCGHFAQGILDGAVGSMLEFQ